MQNNINNNINNNNKDVGSAKKYKITIENDDDDDDEEETKTSPYSLFHRYRTNHVASVDVCDGRSSMDSIQFLYL